MKHGKRVIIVGGVAGGASCATRARRLSETARILMVERGPHVSFANCGLPYHIGGEIPHRAQLLLNTPEDFQRRFNIDVRVRTEAVSIDSDARTVRLRDLTTEREWDEPFDDLVLAPGAAPIVPPIPGIDRPGHFTLRNVPDTDRINSWIEETDARRAVVIGAGFIGLEMVEQLHRRGIEVSLVELLPQVLPPLDVEMAAMVGEELERHGIEVVLGDSVIGFEESDDAKASIVLTKEGRRLPADVVIVGVGVRPETALAESAGIALGKTGGILVDDYLRTSAPGIWAVGDAVEAKDGVSGGRARVPLAGPANRQGRLAADNIFGANKKWKGTFGTSILRVFGLTAAATGANERRLKKEGTPHRVTHVHRGDHAGYFPGASTVHLKLIWSPTDGRILGAQGVGKSGVDKRIDVIATAQQAGMTIEDLADLELSYAPPYGAAKDPVNILGMAACNEREGLVSSVQWHGVEALLAKGGHELLDVRSREERAVSQIEGSLHIPLEELRARFSELPRDRRLIVYCASGQRSYSACRILLAHGIDCVNLSGSMQTWSAAMAAPV